MPYLEENEKHYVSTSHLIPVDTVCAGQSMHIALKGLFGGKVWLMLESRVIISLIAMSTISTEIQGNYWEGGVCNVSHTQVKL